MLAASEVDAKNPLLKLASSSGRLVERKVAARVKDLDMAGVVRELLAPLGKRLGPGAEEALKDRVGGNMRQLQSELEKLAVYADGNVISADDVRMMVSKSREDDFFELSEALQKRNLAAALRYVNDALGQDKHPLMVLGALTSNTRTLLENHERARKLVNGPFRMSFNEFKSRLFPQIEREAKESKGRAPHPFAVYAGMQAAMGYSRNELLEGLVSCADADLALKSSGNGRLVLEGLLIKLCGPRAAQVNG
jgi:DNA polymerase-3 subunit delta